MLELVIEAMVDALLVVDIDGRITMANSAALDLTGYARDELRGRRVAEVLVDDASGLRTVVRQRIADGHVLRREESWLVPREGERIPVSVTGAPVLDERGALQGIVVVARDVREVRDLLVQLRAAQTSIAQQLEEARSMLLLAERRATLGTLAGGFGHELRNIAQIQIAAADELAAALAADEDITILARQLLPELERVGEHIKLHGNKLMELARPGPDRVQPADLNSIVHDVVAMLRLSGKLGSVAVELVLAPEPLFVTVNRTRIEQILVNLVSNAVDAGADRIAIEVRATGDGRRIACAVRDTGEGIAAEHLDRIFEPFFTTKGPDQGTGLGLPVVRDIVTSYGGTIDVASEPGHGTTFTFELPR